jgi:hypothetical protein
MMIKLFDWFMGLPIYINVPIIGIMLALAEHALHNGNGLAGTIELALRVIGNLLEAL